MNYPVDINPKHLDMVLDILHKHLPADVKVWVFGSRADWTTKDSSDLDLVLEGSFALDYNIMLALDTAFEESSLPYKVDVIDLNQISSSFRQIVEAQMVPLPLPNSLMNSEAEWNETVLGDVLTLQRGFDLPHNERVPGPFPVIASTEQVGLHEEAKVKGPGVVMGRSGSLGGAQYITNDFWPLNTTLWVKDFKGNDRLFCYYLLKSLDLSTFNAGSGVPTLNRNHIHTLPLQLPPLTEQRSIARILGALDGKIDLNRRMNQTLEGMARTLFKSWFVDFDPVRAKMDDTWRPGKSLPGLPTYLYEMFPDSMVESELGEIPEGWDLKPLDEIANFRNGLALQNHRPVNNEPRLPVVKIAQLRNGRVDGKEWAKGSITPECIIDDGDVIFSWSGSLLVKVWCGGRAALNQHLFKVTSIEYPKWFFLSWVEQHLKRFQDIATDKATTMGHIRRHHLREVECIIPDKSFLNVVNNMFENLFTKQVLNNIQSRSLVNLRDILLPKLISGKLRVSPTTRQGRK